MPDEREKKPDTMHVVAVIYCRFAILPQVPVIDYIFMYFCYVRPPTSQTAEQPYTRYKVDIAFVIFLYLSQKQR